MGHEVFHIIGYAIADKGKVDLIEINYFLKKNKDRLSGTYVFNKRPLIEGKRYTKGEMTLIYLLPIAWHIICIIFININLNLPKDLSIFLFIALLTFTTLSSKK